MLKTGGKIVVIAILTLCTVFIVGCSQNKPSASSETTASSVSSVASNMTYSDKSSNSSEAVIQVPDNILYIKAHQPISYPGLDSQPFILLKTKSDFDAFLNVLPDNYSTYDIDEKLVSSDSVLPSTIEEFNDEFFNTHDLLCASYDATSGSDEMYIKSIAKVGNDYIVDFQNHREPMMMGTDDMAYWVAIIPVDKI